MNSDWVRIRQIKVNLQTLPGLLGMCLVFHGVELLGLIFASMSAAITKKNRTKMKRFLMTLFQTWIQPHLKTTSRGFTVNRFFFT